MAPKVNSVVLDTSVLFKWYHRADEEDADKALLIRDAYLSGALAVNIPDLAIHEFTNALRYRNALNRDDVSASANSLWGLGLTVHPVNRSLSEAAIRISYDCDISVYDSAFVALADRLSSTLLTADQALCGKVAGKHPVCYWLMSESKPDRR